MQPARVQVTLQVRQRPCDSADDPPKQHHFKAILPDEAGKLFGPISSSRRSSFMLDNHLKEDVTASVIQLDEGKGPNPQFCAKYAEDIYRNLCAVEVNSVFDFVDK